MKRLREVSELCRINEQFNFAIGMVGNEVQAYESLFSTVERSGVDLIL